MVSTPLYDTLGEEAIVHIVTQTEMRTAFVALSKIDNLVRLKPQLPTLKLVVAFGEPSEEQMRAAKAVGLEIISISGLEKVGKDKPSEPNMPKPGVSVSPVG